MSTKRYDIDRIAYPFTSQRKDLPEGSIHYIDEGVGEPVVFVHGTPTWSFEWRHAIAALQDHYRCIAPDHLGFGLSERPNGYPYTPESHAETFARFLGSLDLEPFTLVVHDFGGPIALPYALSQPNQVKRLVLVNTWMWSLQGDRSMETAAKFASSAIGRVLYERLNLSLRVLMPSAYADRQKLTREIHRQYLERFPDRQSRRDVLWTLAKSLLASSAHYDTLWQQRQTLKNIPTLILWGNRDPLFKQDSLQRLKQALPHAHAEELDAGHWPHEEQPERFNSHLKRFLQETEAMSQ